MPLQESSSAMRRSEDMLVAVLLELQAMVGLWSALVI
jgi:hypothetical protein